MIDIVDDGLLEFEVMVGNTAPSTVAGKKIASKCFNKCLILMGHDLINDLEESVLCDPDILGKFATYLAKYYVTKDDKLLMCDSAGQYLSGAFNCIQDRFPKNEYYNKADKVHPWYTELRQALRNDISLRCQILGDAIASKSFPIGHDLLCVLSAKLLHLNSADAVEQGFNLILQYNSGGGRASEGSILSANGSYWDSILHAWTVNWNQKKLRRQDITNYVNDYECLEADFYFWFMLYLIVSGGTCKTKAQCDNKSGNFIQPHLAALQGSGAASKVTKNVKMFIICFQ